MSDDGAVTPGFLLLSGLPPDWLAAAATVVLKAGGHIVVSCAAAQAVVLEPGSEPRSVLVALWESEQAAHTAWPTVEAALGPLSEGVLALAGCCAPDTVAPPFPCRANAAPVDRDGVACHMLVEGVVTKPEPIGRYRDIIFPMISAAGAWYLIYAPRDQIALLRGEWGHHALIVSRWPDLAAARQFWYGERYQTLAIPTRAGAGQFSVLLLPGEEGG